MKRLVLTFDVEDFINPNEITATRSILEILAKHGLKGLFFITGHVAEKLAQFPDILNMLGDHEIGFHSSGHSVHPTIPEYTDVESYEQAYEISLEREASHIDPVTGHPEGEGGFRFLQKLFRSKRIRAFRAPGMSWTPPNLEALASLGIEFDFSSNITDSKPVEYKGMTFYPYTLIQKWHGTLYDYECLVTALLKREISVLNLHPTLYVNQYEWDSIYYEGNPSNLRRVPQRPFKESNSLFKRFDLLLKRISFLQDAKLLAIDPNLDAATANLKINKGDVERVYSWSMRWPKRRFHYFPRFVRSHFRQFFESAIEGVSVRIGNN
jgi:peptidoglycan/xylan/chitin deacetylase (PgdA/CDA1 family)